MDQDDAVIYVEISGGRPFAMVTRDEDGATTLWDLNWSKKDKTLYRDKAGSGGDGTDDDPIAFQSNIGGTNRYWAADGIAVHLFSGKTGKTIGRRPNARNKIDKLPRPYTPNNLYFRSEEYDGRLVYCSVCNDNLVPRDASRWVCPHVCWSDAGHYKGCGSQDVDNDDHEEGVLACLKVLEFEFGRPHIEHMLKNAKAGKLGVHRAFSYGHLAGSLDLAYTNMKDPIRIAENAWSELEEPDPHAEPWENGVIWLMSLTRKTKAAQKLTAKWISGYLRSTGTKK